MKGIDLSREYFNQYGKPMLEKDFADILPYLAVGFVGGGSERYGFDDEISKDHDYEVGFSIYLPSEDLVDSRKEFALERAYAKLPAEFMGIKRQVLSPVGGNRNGVIRTADFYSQKIGNEKGDLSVREWLTIPDYAFSEATNGEVFLDKLGEFTDIRNKLLNIPEDVRLKRLAGNLLVMAQAGQYNYMRTVYHGQKEAAVLSAHNFVNATIKVIYLLNGKFAPYYKWAFKGLESLNEDKIKQNLSFILLTEGQSEKAINSKYQAIEEVCTIVAERLKQQGITKAVCNDLEKHSYSLNDMIKDGDIRNENIFVSV